MNASEQHEIRTSYHARVREEVLELVPEGKHTVLDIGGGIGASSAHLKSIGKCAKAVVVDLVAENALPEIDANYGGNIENPSLLWKIKSEQGGMDVILCLDVLEHLQDPWAVVRQCHDILNDGGIIVASIPNIRNYRVVFPLLFQGRFELTDSGLLDRTHLRWFVEKTAEELMTSSGLTLEYCRGQIYGWKKKLFNALTLGLFRRLLYLQYFIRVRK